MRNLDDEGHAKLWHAWCDKPGMPYIPMFLKDGRVFSRTNALYDVSSAEKLISEVASNKLFLLSGEIFSTGTFSYIDELIGKKPVVPYLSRGGYAIALRISQKRGMNGFIVPARSWGLVADNESCELLIHMFDMFGYQAPTPASLSEKVLRSTMGEYIHIRRPSVSLRRDILNNHVGGRIDTVAHRMLVPQCFEYDRIKAYPSISLLVVDPRISPVYHVLPSLHDIFSYKTGYWKATIFPVHCRFHPIIGEIEETMERWLWTEEIEDCMEAGYKIGKIQCGYGWRQMSDFMGEWANILFEKHEGEKSKNARAIIKQMMVGLPGRFLRHPEIFRLIPLELALRDRIESVPLVLRDSIEGEKLTTSWAVACEYDVESTALSHVGSYIVMKMRQELYRTMIEEEKRGNVVLRSYIDCYTTLYPTCIPSNLGDGLGQWKEKRYGFSLLEENRFIGIEEGKDLLDVKIPGIAGDARIEMIRRFKEQERMYAAMSR